MSHSAPNSTTSTRRGLLTSLLALATAAAAFAAAVSAVVTTSPQATNLASALHFPASPLIAAFALALKRGDRAAAWGLVLVQAGSLIPFVAYWHWGGLVPVILLAIFLRQALGSDARQDGSIAIADIRAILVYELAFFEAVWLPVDSFLHARGLSGESSLLNPVNIVANIAVFLWLTGAARQRQVWAGYSLALLQIPGLYRNLAHTPAYSYVYVAFIFAYLFGTAHLRKVKAPTSRPGVVVTVLILLILALATLLTQR